MKSYEMPLKNGFAGLAGWIFLLMLIILVCGCQKEHPLRQSEELLQSGKYLEAAEQLEKIVAANERNAKARVLLAQAYDKLGRFHDAISQLKTASRLYTAQPEERGNVRITLAKIYLKLGNRESGFRELRAILRPNVDEVTLAEIAGLVGDAYKVVQLTKDDSDNYSPLFSPDGKRIAFSSFRLDNGEIYLMDLSGRVRQRVTFTTDFNESSPAFLSDPHYIFYSSEPKTSREVKVVLQSSGSTPIYAGFNVTHIYSKVTQEILPVGFGVRAPSTSSNRKRIVYESNTDGNLELYLLDFSGMNLGAIQPDAIKSKRLTHNDVDDGSPTFFPDREKLVFVSSRGDVHQLFTMDIGGSNETHLNPNPYDCYSPTVSPDGETIAFVSARDGDIEIYVMDADGTNERRLTNGIGVSMQPTFSPDGTKLAFVSDRSDTFQIYLMDFNLQTTRQELVQRLRY